MGDRLRPLWDFDDLDASEAAFRAALADEQTDEGRAEVLTQLARVEGLRDRFAEGDGSRRGRWSSSSAPRAPVSTRRGRLRRSGGDPTPRFALGICRRGRSRTSLAVDAAHIRHRGTRPSSQAGMAHAVSHG
jgi:hypothetical protein